MFLDEVIVSGIVIVAAIIGLSAYVIAYAYKHIKQDIKDHPGE
ncbi:hypothetical protein [Marinicellulosiphila megalodicopiae]